MGCWWHWRCGLAENGEDTHHTTTCAHHLAGAWANDAGITHEVLVLKRPLEDVRHRGHASVRMIGKACTFGCVEMIVH
jgi:hypothetical protein